jgi:MOSC N-terminal beta barrel domain
VAEGVLSWLARWPVKSLGGEALAAARLDWRGLGGDRAHALLDRREGREGRWLTVRQAPRMLAWSAAYPDAPDDRLDPADPPAPSPRAPDGATWGWDDPGLEEALAADLGVAVRRHRDPGGQQDLQATVLVTTEASRQAVAEALGRPLELRRFRPNLHLEAGRARVRRGGLGRRPPPRRRGHPGPVEPLQQPGPGRRPVTVTDPAVPSPPRPSTDRDVAPRGSRSQRGVP